MVVFILQALSKPFFLREKSTIKKKYFWSPLNFYQQTRAVCWAGLGVGTGETHWGNWRCCEQLSSWELQTCSGIWIVDCSHHSVSGLRILKSLKSQKYLSLVTRCRESSCGKIYRIWCSVNTNKQCHARNYGQPFISLFW